MKKGTNKITLDEINKEIGETRKAIKQLK